MSEVNTKISLCTDCKFDAQINGGSQEQEEAISKGDEVHGVDDLLGVHFAKPNGVDAVKTELTEHLKTNTCRFIETGQCEAALFLVERSLRGSNG